MTHRLYDPYPSISMWADANAMSKRFQFRDKVDANHFIERTATLLRVLDPTAPRLLNVDAASGIDERRAFLDLLDDVGCDPASDTFIRDDDLLYAVFGEYALRAASSGFSPDPDGEARVEGVFSRPAVLAVLREINAAHDGLVTHAISEWSGEWGDRLRETIEAGWAAIDLFEQHQPDETNEPAEAPAMGA